MSSVELYQNLPSSTEQRVNESSNNWKKKQITGKEIKRGEKW